MPEPCVLLSGPNLAVDHDLIQELQKHAATLQCRDDSQIDALMETCKVDLVVLEITTGSATDLNTLRRIKSKFPQVAIIAINGNGDRKALIKAFALGARDAFSKAYDRALLVERVRALLRQR